MGVPHPKRSLKLRDEDRKLIEELGLDSLTSFESIEEKISLLNMRQLYKLKLMFLRISREKAWLSEPLQTRIQNNELRAFSQAFFSLWQAGGQVETPAGAKDKA